ncbi:MAG: hypothetical protein JW807_06640 [Spirochaetes bacterium]|nr:hypothetical protein [Spirochaetota bacterium]
MTLLSAGAAFAEEKPLVGIAAIRTNSPRATMLTTLLEENMARIIDSTDSFKPVNPALLREELKRFGCTEERCMLGFASEAGMSLVIRADFDDSDDFMFLSMRAYGIGVPYYSRVVYQYTARIPMTGKLGTSGYGSIMEEHAGIFLSKLFARYRVPLFLEQGPGAAFHVGRSVSGTFDAYRPDPEGEKRGIRGFRKIGAVRIKNGSIPAPGATHAGDFILTGFRELAESMDNHRYRMKKEIVFRKPSPVEAIYALLITGPASATMPILAPTVGYYRASDWQGLALWGFNLAPYLYLEINGLANYWANYYNKKKSTPRDVQAQYYFGLYMLCAGGATLFVDSLAHSMIEKASNYQGIQPFMGNALTAGYLALVSGGAGHFYRGDRLWGYLYYHADNLLLYFTLREFLPDRKFNPLTRTFTRAKVSKLRAYSLLSAACAVKIAEVVHAVLMRDDIQNGDIIDEGYAVEPIIYSGEDYNVSLGLQYSYRW